MPHKGAAQHKVPEIIQASNLPSPASMLPDLQTRQYSEVLRTSTRIDVTTEISHRPHPALRRTSSSPKPAPRTTHTRNNKPSQILFIRDSLITSVHQKNGISSGNTVKVTTQIKLYDLNKFSHVIIYVCDNDASNGTDFGYFEEVYDQTIQLIKETNNQCQIILCISCLRRDTRLSKVNVVILSLAQYHHVSFIDQNRAFHDWNGKLM